MSNRDVRAACAARQSTTNDIEDYDEPVDFLSEKVHSIVRIHIPDERARSKRWPGSSLRASSTRRTPESPSTISSRQGYGQRVSRGDHHRQRPMLYSNFCKVCGDENLDDGISDDDEPCDDSDCNLCGDICDNCTYCDDIPRYVYEDGLIRRINVRNGSDD